MNCGYFEWLTTAMDMSKKVNLRVKLEVSLDDLCNAFDNKLK